MRLRIFVIKMKYCIIVGLGEMAGVFSRGLLKAGFSLIPARRQDSLEALCKQFPDPEMVLLTVGEKDLHPVLQTIPEVWQNKLCLLQNELLPHDWEQYQLSPTVISVWFEKKPGREFKVLVPSPVFGPAASIVEQALQQLQIATERVHTEERMLFELVRKNLYILTTNICGLKVGGTVSQLWQDHSLLMNQVFDDVLLLQEALTDTRFNRDDLLDAVLQAFEGDPEHQCMGRSAPARLQRALELSSRFNLDTAKLRAIHSETATQ